jgi:uncharacterized ion transporter superfamily protein YfcC
MNDERESKQLGNLEKETLTSVLITEADSSPIVLSQKKQRKCKNCCSFPSAYTVLIIIEIIIFLLTYIIPKGLFDTIEYSSEENKFIIRIHDVNNTIIRVNATKEELDKRNISVPLESFLNGIITRPISIPNTYKKIEGETTNFFGLFSYPIKGLIESADICFFVLIIGGTLNMLVEMDSLSSGMRALSRITKGKEFLLLILILILIAIGGTTYGMFEEIISFYPILMPIFLQSGFDGILAMAPLYLGAICGNMFCTMNATSVVLASITAGINFSEGIVLRIIGLVLSIIIAVAYLFIYYKRIQKDNTKSIVYDIKEELENKYLKPKKENIENNNDIEEKEKIITEQNPLKEDKPEEIIENESDTNKFTCIQKISLIILFSGFIALILGVLLLGWSIVQMATIFLLLAIIFMFMLRKGEQKAIDAFMKGAGEFCGVAMIIGIARGINLTLENEKISDTILESMSNLVDGLPKIWFSIIMLVIYILIGFFIQSQSGLAVLSIPPFAPLADKVNCKREVVVNAFMFGQELIGLIAPTGMILIVTQLVGIKFTYWLKFIWPYMLILFIFLCILIILNATIF